MNYFFANQKFGFTAPVLTDESGNILNGHGRTQAAIELKPIGLQICDRSH
jgi:hypothetical protein